MAEKPVRYAEDYQAGQVFELGSCEVTREEIVEFAAKYDPHAFHLDDSAADASIFGGLTASGWLTALKLLQLMHTGGYICRETALGSPGHEEMLWPRPVRPGDRLRGRVEVREVKLSKSRPELGFIRNTATLTNQHGEVVFVTTSTSIVRTRAAGKPSVGGDS